jgi:hypothetical protein
VTDELPPARPDKLSLELEKSRESAAELQRSLAHRIGTSRVAQTAAGGLERAAQYVHMHDWKDVAAGFDRAVRGRPVVSIVVAVAAGFLIGRALRPR